MEISTGMAVMRSPQIPHYTPRRPSPLNPCPVVPPPSKNTNEARLEFRTGGSTRRARTLSPTQKLLRRKAAKVMHTNTLKRQVEAYEAKALRALANKDVTMLDQDRTTLPNAPKSFAHPGSRQRKRRRSGTLWALMSTKPVLNALSRVWPFKASRKNEVAWKAGDATIAPVTVA